MPPAANHLIRSTNKPHTDVMNPSGVPRKIPHVDHVQMPELQEG